MPRPIWRPSSKWRGLWRRTESSATSSGAARIRIPPKKASLLNFGRKLPRLGALAFRRSLSRRPSCPLLSPAGCAWTSRLNFTREAIAWDYPRRSSARAVPSMSKVASWMSKSVARSICCAPLMGPLFARVRSSSRPCCPSSIAAWAREQFGLEEPAFQWSSQDYMPLDHVPYVGRMPRSRDELMVATGFGKCGLINGTVAAMILRDKMLNRENPWPRLYSSTRLDARNSARRFVQGNLDVARHFVSYRVQNPSRTRASRLAPGDGGIVKLDGVKVAAFRDQDGNLHTFSPNCPHMGCPLTWNNAEKSWDCPCHGSRFGAMGHYLQGPAVKDMKPKK